MGAKELAASMGNGSRIGPDVAAAMSFGKASREATEVVFQRYVNDRADIDKLYYLIFDNIVTMAVRWGWKPHKKRQGRDRKGIITKMVFLAIAEEVMPNRCITCFGVGTMVIGERVCECEKCGGSGRRIIADQERADLLGISRQTLLRWKPMYQAMRDCIGGYDEEGVRAIARGFWERA